VCETGYYNGHVRGNEQKANTVVYRRPRGQREKRATTTGGAAHEHCQRIGRLGVGVSQMRAVGGMAGVRLCVESGRVTAAGLGKRRTAGAAVLLS
jgi:hypothetical protein